MTEIKNCFIVVGKERRGDTANYAMVYDDLSKALYFLASLDRESRASAILYKTEEINYSFNIETPLGTLRSGNP